MNYDEIRTSKTIKDLKQIIIDTILSRETDASQAIPGRFRLNS